MRRLFTLLVLLLAARIAAGVAMAAPAPPKILAPAGILMDPSTGAVLWARDPDTPRPIASTTKIMTVLLALERGDLDSTVTVSPDAAEVKECSLHLKAGEQMTLRDLLYGTMLRSANDGSVAIAEHIAGSVPAFVAMMNEKAAELGCTHTHFANANGLSDTDHYSTPRDLALMTQAALRNPVFCDIVRTPVYTVERSKNPYDRRVKSLFGWFLKSYPGAEGVKTGYTRAAGHCFVAAAVRGQFPLVAVVLHSPHVKQDTATLLDWGFKYHRGGVAVRPGPALGTALVDGGRAGTVMVAAAAPVHITLRRGAPPVQPDLSGLRVRAPFKAGETVGTVPLVSGGRKVGEAPVVALSGVGLSGMRLAGRVLVTGGGAVLLGAMVGATAENTRRRRRRLAARRRRPDPRRARPRERAHRRARPERRRVRRRDHGGWPADPTA